MRHYITISFLLLYSLTFAQNQYSESITKHEIKEHIYYLASDELEGRDTGSEGQKKAAEYIANELKEYGVLPIAKNSEDPYFQKFTYSYYPETENVIGYIPADIEGAGWIIITAHYDHLGKKGTIIYNGADDNASGTTAILEIAEALSKAKESGVKLNKNIMFIAFSAEEKGLIGSKHFCESKIADTLNMNLNINMDMIGRSVKYGLIETFKEAENPDFKEDSTFREDYVYLFRKGKNTRKYLKYSKKSGKKKKFKIDTHPGSIVRLVYKSSSDHKPFYDMGVPIMVYFTGLHPDYHTERDTPDKIDYDNLTIITQIIFETVYNIVTEG
jgi:Zn-dependent M28 family amino/carboxypeptidase